MAIWQWFLLVCVVLVLSLLAISLFNHRMANKAYSHASRVKWMFNGNDRVFLLLPGILGRGEEQFEPLLDGLNARGSVDVRSYSGHGFDLVRIAKTVARDVNMYHRYNIDVVIVGASIGGLVGFEALKDINNPDKVKLVMIDSPHGVSTMTAFPDRLAILTRIFKGAPLPNVIGNRLLEKMKVGPKREFIDFPVDVDEDRHFETITVKALAGLSGHQFSMWWSQLVTMVHHRPTVVDDEAEISYVACLGEANDVVTQSLARERWQETIPQLRVVEIEAAHCGFLQQPARWNSLFADAIA